MINFIQMESMLNISEGARLLRVHPNTLRRWADSGIIQTYRTTPRCDRQLMKKDITRLLSTTKLKNQTV